MNMPPIVSQQEWGAAREELLDEGGSLAPAMRWPPSARGCRGWQVENEYRLEGPNGTVRLLDLLKGAGADRLRFFYEPGVAGWPEGGCRGCSFLADQVAHLARLNPRDTALALGCHTRARPDIEHCPLKREWAGKSRGTRSRTTSTPTSACRPVARHQCLPPRRRAEHPHLLHQRWSQRQSDQGAPGATSTSPR